MPGKHRPGPSPADGTRFTSELYRARYWNDDEFAAGRRLRRVASSAGLSLVQLACRWVLAQPFTTCMLLGGPAWHNSRSNLADVDGPPLDDAVLAACDEARAGLAGAAPDCAR